ncbi:hypothetical protein FQN57_006099 [Myotisia sp. PD_48]|nr:hypothetical protein FQN57_006099 [Myotisia sp. PD_48]
MNQVNMQGMNSMVGGPMGGIPMVNSVSAPRSEPSTSFQDAMTAQLNTYIYDYFLKQGYHDCARALWQDDKVSINTNPVSKPSTGRREGEVNGVDGDDSKDNTKQIPDDLPRPNLGDSQQSSFLFDWFNIFWDVYSAQRKKSRTPEVVHYLNHTQSLLRLRDQQQNQMIRQAQMMPSQFNMRQAPRGMMPANMQKGMVQGTQNMTPQQIAQYRNQQAQMMHQMQREHSDMEMNGHRPQSPSSVENAPSPSKRPRLDGSQVNGQPMAPNGRPQGQGMPGQPNQQANNAILMQHGLNPRNLTAQQLQVLQAQSPAVAAKSIQVYNQNLALHHTRSAMNNQGIPNGLMNPGVMPNQGDMMQPMHDGQGLMPVQEFYGNGQMAQMRPGMQAPNGQNGHHALQDYQMQLMLLEQQNKKRLLLARQEHDSITRAEGQPSMHTQSLPPGTSPQGSRAGTSPNPSEQMKRGTPKIAQTGLPGSPNVGDAMQQGRGSPASMNFGGQMPQDMSGAAFFNMKSMQDVGPNGMRPPSSNPAYTGAQMPQSMEALARPGGASNRMPSGNWQQSPQGPPMMGQQPPGQAQPSATPQERNAMPPPQAPPAGTAPNNGRQSPQPGTAAPPTPQQTGKAAPKKKDAKDNPKKRPKKMPNSNTAATPTSEAEPPTPSTPGLTVHPASLKSGPNVTSNPAQQTSVPTTQAMGQPQQPPPSAAQSQPPPAQNLQPPPPQPSQVPPPHQQQTDPSQPFDIALPDVNSQNFNLDFSGLDNADLLENFDFDTFLNTDDPSSFAFETGLGYPTDGVEAGTGDGM